MATELHDHKQQVELSACNSNMLYIIRIVAAQCVLVGHLFSFLGLTALASGEYFPHIQSLAVIVFFMLSGFLTDYSLRRKITKNEQFCFRDYLFNHYSRIFGSLIPALLFIALVDGTILSLLPERYSAANDFTWKAFFVNFLMFPYRFIPFGTGRPLWTLFYEWWLYIVYGYGYLVCKKSFSKGQLKIWQWFVLLVLAGVSLRNAMPATLLAFLLGVIVNRIYHKVDIKYGIGILLCGVAFVACGLYTKDAYNLVFPFLLAGFLLQVMAYGKKRCAVVSPKVKKALQFMSGYTYPLYLTHYTIIECLLCVMPNVRGWRLFAIAFAISNAFAIVFYVVEQGIRKKWRKHKGRLEINSKKKL